MRQLVMTFLLLGCLSSSIDGLQRGAAASPAAPPLRACSILTKDLVAPFTQNKRLLDIIPPEEEPMGTAGSACEYGVVRLQISPARAGVTHTAPSDAWKPAPGTGDAAFFRSNGKEYAELLVWSGSYYLTLQVGVPTGSTPDAIKPDTIALANAIIAKLR